MRSALVFLAALSSFNVMAAVPKKLSPMVVDRDKLVMEAIRLPLDNRVQALKAQGRPVLERLYQLAFDRNKDLELRWRAITALPYLDKDIGLQAVEKALSGDEWYLRNAATLALPTLDRTYAVNKSGQLLSDPALVVRTAAAQNLLKLNGIEKESLLWEKLNSPQNFRKGQSLWVRKHIARALAAFAKAGSEQKFISLLADTDVRLHDSAVRGLERLSGLTTPKKLKSRSEKQNFWLTWWQKKGATTNL